MKWTPEQRAVIDHPLETHAVVRAVPGAGKTTTLVGRVERLLERGVDAGHIRVVMFNKDIKGVFEQRLLERRISGVRVTTFDGLGLEVLRKAERDGLLSLPLEVVAKATAHWARAVYREHVDAFESAEDIERAVGFWKAHLVSPIRAAFPPNPVLVDAYEKFEALRRADGVNRIAFEDMVYVAVGVLRTHPRLLGRIEHFLVDEFQDVNPGRVELMKRLSGPDTSVMAVGDEDQAINEWCGAHPRFFTDFARLFPSRPTREYRLTASFRFGAVLASAATALIRRNSARADVAIAGEGSAVGRIVVVGDVADTVVRLLNHGHPGADIAVLYRARSQAARALADLAARGVSLETEDFNLLTGGRGPELALGYLRYCVDQAPVVFEAVWPIIYGPDRYIGKEAFYSLVSKHGACGLRAVLLAREDAEALGLSRTAIREMSNLARTLDRMSGCKTAAEALDRLAEDIDAEHQLRDRIASEKERQIAIAAFRATHALLRGIAVSPAAAGPALEALDATRGASGKDRVWVSTIHKAKGLQWRFVVLPELLDGACPAEQRGSVVGTVDQPGGIEQSDWMEQERRIFYVGFTRAADAVYLQVPKDEPSPFIAELRTNEPPRPPRAGARWSTEEDERVRAGWLAGQSVPELADVVGRSHEGIASRLVRLGLVDTREDARTRG